MLNTATNFKQGVLPPATCDTDTLIVSGSAVSNNDNNKKLVTSSTRNFEKINKAQVAVQPPQRRFQRVLSQINFPKQTIAICSNNVAPPGTSSSISALKGSKTVGT